MTALQEAEEFARQAKAHYEQLCKERTTYQEAHLKAIMAAKAAYTTWEDLEKAALTLRLQGSTQPELVVLEGGSQS